MCVKYVVLPYPPQNDKGKTALDYAVLYSCDDCAALLRAAGATGSKKNKVAAKATKDKKGKKDKKDKKATTKKDKESDTEEGEAEDDAKETDALTGDDDDAHKTAFPDTNDLSFFGGACCCFMAVRLSHV